MAKAATLEQPSTTTPKKPDQISPASRNLPSLEIFATQLPILIRQGSTKTITITGAVYDQPFQGNITLQPSPNFTSGCPLFGNFPFNGVYNGVSFPVGPNSVALQLEVTGPTNLPPGNYTCTLKYDAEYITFPGIQFPVGKGNTVSLAYTLKRKKRPGDPDL